MKVISGFLKGRNIIGFDIEGTRPTMDRVKESLFASIQGKIKDSVVLDLFSGSGNLGIEAISNGSRLVYFNDSNKESVKVIKKNLDNFCITSCKVLNMDYLKCLDYLKGVKFDLIFLDPPYKMLVIPDILKIILTNNLLNDDGLVICEVSSDLESYPGYELIKEKKYGDKKVYIYRRINE